MNASQEYLEMQIESASQGQKLIMLHDGLIRFAKIAMKAIDDKRYDVASENLKYAQNIALHLRSSLVHDHTPDLTGNLDTLYSYWYILLTRANIDKSIEPLHELIPLVKQMRDTWDTLEKQLIQEGNG
ncbi:flagellar export chaperone FliS [Alicyclobacillus ferrooxydans]|uniref:Flagellar secretion chaperone FliS n=1 Tax=Alicyclobacillus ferrooxydans TaxID=471514 RepID=A0A0P9CX82_9BACL|nr:flagellar export chaperone FliS [Alicyclobacillus ferrooxydans]KPV44367.1 hypothetical protein AN477_06960 [Alicyclobacillus ferrooxydans]